MWSTNSGSSSFWPRIKKQHTCYIQEHRVLNPGAKATSEITFHNLRSIQPTKTISLSKNLLNIISLFYFRGKRNMVRAAVGFIIIFVVQITN